MCKKRFAETEGIKEEIAGDSIIYQYRICVIG